MKKFNINHYMYIQITDTGWQHLSQTVGEDYIKHCIEPYKTDVDGETWYRLQAHSVFRLPINFGGQLTYNSNVMFDNKDLT